MLKNGRFEFRVLVGTCVALMTVGAGTQTSAGEITCLPSGQTARLAGVPEASGVALSRLTPGRLWTHNDSGTPRLVALDTDGYVTARVQLSGARPTDWEAIATGPCPDGSCVFIGDIGDNKSARARITVFRLAEPSSGAAGISEAFQAIYPDGPHNAETLLVPPDGRIYVVTKSPNRPPGLYRFPDELSADKVHQLERIDVEGSPFDEPITDGAVSPSGRYVALRTERRVLIYESTAFFAGRWSNASTVDVGRLHEAQGEGVAIADDGTLYLTGEGAGESTPGTFNRLNCTVGPSR